MSETSTLPLFPFDTPPEQDGEPEHRRLLTDCPVSRVRMADGTPVWVVASAAGVRTVLTDPRFSRAAASVPGAPTLTPGISSQSDNMLNMDPPGHTRLRRLVAGPFTARMVEQRRPRIQEIADGLVDAMVAQGPPADLVEALAMPLPITVVCDLLGMPYEDVEPVRRLSEVTQAIDAYPVEAIMRAAGEMVAYITALVAARQATPGDDLTTQLIDARDRDDRMSPHEVVQMITGIIVAGHETTACQLPISMLTLFRHPDQLALLRERPELAPGAVDELLRYVRLLPAAFSRVTTADVEVDGFTVPAGESVFALQYAANRDGAAYPEPDRFDITRAGPPSLTFGTGPHVCLGATLARVELQVAIGTLLRRLPRLALAVPEASIEWRLGRFIRGVRALPVTW
jgi:cytochrome P450